MLSTCICKQPPTINNVQGKYLGTKENGFRVEWVEWKRILKLSRGRGLQGSEASRKKEPKFHIAKTMNCAGE